MAYPPEDFESVNLGVNPGGEVWGENDHGCFSLISGQFVPKEKGKKGYASFHPEVSIVFPGEEDKEED